MLPERVASLLGLSRRAGQIALGDWAVTNALRRGRAQVVFLAADAGRSTARRFRTLAGRVGVPLWDGATREELGHALGADPKAVVAVTSPGLARAIMDALQGAGLSPPPVRPGRDPDGTR